MKTLFILFTAAMTSLVTSIAQALPDVSSAPNDAYAYFVSPQNGATLSSPVKVVFGLKGMGVAPAGTEVEHTGHHHLIINAPAPKSGEFIPSDDNHKHFGKGQTETTIELPKGTHTLQLVLGDYIHRPHDNPVVSEVITITVE